MTYLPLNPTAQLLLPPPAPSLKVYVVGQDDLILRMFREKGWESSSLEDCNLVVFTGGADVDPSFYGEENFASMSNLARDRREQEVYTKALELGKCMAGICRGNQFLAVMNGHKLYQHIEGHATGRDHVIKDKVTGEEVLTTSTHHQSVRLVPEKEAEVIATASLGKPKYVMFAGKITVIPTEDDVEVVWYESTGCLGFQGHPEYQNKECRDYFFDLLSRKFGF